ncbi:cytosine permease, partial [Clostridioides difficile]|nr:cytosine permease [Clostridioides difficile]
CEYYFIQGRTYKHREGINWIAVISWLIGFATSYYSSKINFLIPPINGIVVSMVIYYILMKCFGIKDK